MAVWRRKVSFLSHLLFGCLKFFFLKYLHWRTPLVRVCGQSAQETGVGSLLTFPKAASIAWTESFRWLFWLTSAGWRKGDGKSVVWTVLDKLLRFPTPNRRSHDTEGKFNPGVLRMPLCSQIPTFNKSVEIYRPMLFADDGIGVSAWLLISRSGVDAKSQRIWSYTSEHNSYFHSGIHITHNRHLHHITAFHEGYRQLVGSQNKYELCQVLRDERQIRRRAV